MSGRLAVPNPAVHASFLSALREYHAEGLHRDVDAEALADRAGFLAWVENLRRAGIDGTAACERDRVPHRILWWVDGDRYLGRVRINLELNDGLREFGGHIGYDVRPSARRQGHATALLGAALRRAGAWGIDPALLTCAPENTASRRVIERNGGTFQDISAAGRLRYRCPTRTSAALTTGQTAAGGRP
ncbi:GNAT family N-acetyltransferase [Planosporangium thailandense]|uniref:GNAT family N-acetyltransferase n=1 Tax=Planosporangium thailandense TaxID=765197 RepID=A0ABX0Y2M7_9ACTN|nr:GNAT family N-acetyltransferase [Planosporangium thailandense]NJC71599.1 GNAT family N-acetyltransferase [Planosporangium thailandense]